MLRVTTLLIVVRVVSVVAAYQCDVSLTRCGCGKYTRINNNFGGLSLIELADDTDDWTSYAINGYQVTITHMNGSEETFFRNRLSAATQDLLYRFEKSPRLGGLALASVMSKMVLESPADANYTISRRDSRMWTLRDARAGGEFAAFNLDEPLASNIFLQNSSIVTIVDQNCKFTTLPLKSLNRQQQSLLAKASEGQTTGLFDQAEPRRRQQDNNGTNQDQSHQQATEKHNLPPVSPQAVSPPAVNPPPVYWPATNQYQAYRYTH